MPFLPSTSRRHFLQAASAGAVAAAGLAHAHVAGANDNAGLAGSETNVKRLFEALTPEQKKSVCFDWDHQDKNRGLLRTHIAANWRITKPELASDYYSKEQKQIIREVFEGLVAPDWVERFDKQLKDDSGGFGHDQAIAIFGEPGSGKFEFVLTGRHMTLRCDGDSADHVAFGGPIFYGHAAEKFNEAPNHPGNVFWHQAVQANKLYQTFDEKQRKRALLEKAPRESDIAFRGKDTDIPGLPVTEMTPDQREKLQAVLKLLIEPYRQSDRDEVTQCVTRQGGLDAFRLVFYQQGDIGGDGVWDIWRLEGPSFVWHYRGAPHVHTWVNVASDAGVELNA